MATTATQNEKKNRINLPDDVRNQLGLPLGVDIAIFRRKDSITLVPVRPIAEYEGLIQGVAVDFSTIRDKQNQY